MDISNREKALEAVQERYPECTGFVVGHVIDEFLDGHLYTISFKNGEAGLENYVYFEENNVRVFRNQHDLFQGIAKKGSPNTTISRLARIYGVSGSIAMLLTVAIVYLSVNQLTIPEILANALTVIIGFYFGAQSQKT